MVSGLLIRMIGACIAREGVNSVSSNALCPKCGKPIERSEGKPCPHCGAINTEAIISLDHEEPIAVPPATAITAKLPAETADKITCPRCRKRFDASDDPEIPWLSCPFCHEVNPDALVKRLSPSLRRDRALGVFLLITGILGFTLGTCLCGGGMALRHFDQPADSIDIIVIVTWATASLAILSTGAFLMSSERARTFQRNYWGPGAFFLILLLLGVAGWIFAFSTCTFLAK
jgi:hypothetical protein